jgi:hypothetical protein
MALTTSLGRLGYLDWGDWVYGLMSGFISGGAAAVVSGGVVAFKDPEHFNPYMQMGNFIQLVSSVFLISGIAAAMNYLRNKPLPSMKQVETTTKTIEQAPTEAKPIPPPPTVITTVKETHVEPIMPEKKEDK